MFERKLFCAGFLGYFLWIITSGNTENKSVNNLNEQVKTDSLPSIQTIDSSFSPEENSKAFKFVKAYIQKNKFGLAKLKTRSKSSFAVINSIFLKKDIPVDLKYLAIVESGLRPDTFNTIGAAGLWQIMPTTAQELGLKITETADDRLHIYKSTSAIAKYLKQLYEQYNDLLLVVAAYNSGPGYVNRAIKLSGSNNFWDLQNWLPAETRNHVKKFISIRYYFETENTKQMLSKA